MYFGTAYGKPVKVEVLGKEALALIECDKIDKAERESESAKLERALIFLYGKHNI